MFNQIRAEFYKLFHTKALYLTFALILAVFGIFSIGGQQQFVASSSSLDETWKIGETVGFLARAYSDTAHPLIEEIIRTATSLSNRDIEELAYAINQKDNLHKKLQVQIKQEEEQLKQSISNISHDLRTPLTSIQGYLTLLQECEDKQEQGQCIKIIKAKTDYLTDLVQEFYDLSVIENEQVDVECERVDINRIVTDCLIEKYYEFGEIQPTIQTENTPVWIYGNNLICKRIQCHFFFSS